MRERYVEGLWYVGLALAMPVVAAFLMALARMR
jgi:hypothetical protein